MAVKRIVKFVLKMVVAAAVVVGGYFLIKHFTSKSESATDIINKSQTQEIAVNYQNSYDGLINSATANTPQRTRIYQTNNINKLLLEYYNHYMTLTGFQSKNSDATKNEIIKQMENLLEQTKITKSHLDTLKSTPDSANYEAEKNERLRVVANDYFEQTKMFFELNDTLKNYVIQTNYGSENLFTVYEMQLEIVKEYAKYVFEQEIYGKYNESSGGALITSTNSTSFSSVLEKFNQRQVANRNSREETRLFLRYSVIEKADLYNYFSHISDKAEYINSIENQTKKQAMEFLHNYLLQDKF